MMTKRTLGSEIEASIGKYKALLNTLPSQGERWNAELTLEVHRALCEDRTYRRINGHIDGPNAVKNYILTISKRDSREEDKSIAKLYECRLNLATRLLEQRVYEEAELRANPIQDHGGLDDSAKV
jgi:hypothetical protein